jgi:hypothetical protein
MTTPAAEQCHCDGRRRLWSGSVEPGPFPRRCSLQSRARNPRWPTGTDFGGDPGGDLDGEFVDFDGQHSQVLDEAQCRRRTTGSFGMSRRVQVDLVKSAAPLQLRWCRPPRAQFVQISPQPADDACVFADQVVTTVNQQPPFHAPHPRGARPADSVSVNAARATARASIAQISFVRFAI